MEQDLLSANRNTVKVEYCGWDGWKCTKTVRINTNTAQGKLRRAVINAKIAHRIDWVDSPMYNDKSHERVDGSISYRLKWHYAIGRKLSNDETLMLKEAIKNQFGKDLRYITIEKGGWQRGTILVYYNVEKKR